MKKPVYALNCDSFDSFEICVKQLSDSSCFTEILNWDVKLFLDILVDTEQMKNKANAISEVAYEMKENMNRIENLVLNLSLVWKGQAEAEYAAKILYVKKRFRNLYQFIIDYSETIKTIANDYEDTENQFLSKLEV